MLSCMDGSCLGEFRLGVRWCYWDVSRIEPVIRAFDTGCDRHSMDCHVLRSHSECRLRTFKPCCTRGIKMPHSPDWGGWGLFARLAFVERPQFLLGARNFSFKFQQPKFTQG